jgi:transcriptional regulator with XRE-family HTH domain
MAGRTYLREWRKHRALTQEQVIDRLVALDDPLLPVTGASLSRLENGKQPYSERVLEALADIYQCEPWELLGRNPAKEGEVFSLFDRVYRDLNTRQRAQALAIIEALKAAG